MSVDTILARYRRRRRQLLTDRCTITEPGSGMVWNPDTGQDEPDPGTVRATGVRCLFSRPEASDRVVEIGGAPETLRTYNVEIDLAQTAVAVDDTITVTGSLNPLLVGRTLTVIDFADGSWAGSRRLVVRDTLT